MAFEMPQAEGREFFRMGISDVDSDGDGLDDWEEHSLGFDSLSGHTDRYEMADFPRIIAGQHDHGRDL